MSIKKYVAEKDTTITDAFYPNLINRAYYSNMGGSDSLDIFSLYGQVSSSVEKSRVLVQFPIQDIINDRAISKIPNSGSVKFYLKLSNQEHSYTIPKEFKAEVRILSQSWDEGYGLDMESYSDFGWDSTNKGNGSNWVARQSGSNWTVSGSSYINNVGYDFQFKTGLEDLEVDVTDTVEKWINSTYENNGFLVKMSGSFEDGSQAKSFYIKKFSSRTVDSIYKKPVIEARWEAFSVDDRDKFFISSSALSSDDNIMNIYFYNKVSGKLKNIVGNILPGIKFYSDQNLTNEITASYKTITNPVAGVYRGQVSLYTTASVVYDKWYNTSSSDVYFSSSFIPQKRENYDYNEENEYVINIKDNKVSYINNETAKFKFFIRQKNWQPTIYSKAYNNVENESINNLYYKIFRLNDNYVVLDYSTGSLAYTKTSYDSNGNYFDLDMSILEKGYTYGVKLATWDGVNLKEFSNTFKFKVG